MILANLFNLQPVKRKKSDLLIGQLVIILVYKLLTRLQKENACGAKKKMR